MRDTRRKATKSPVSLKRSAWNPSKLDTEPFKALLGLPSVGLTG